MNNLLSAFIGALITIMVMFNGTLSKISGNYTSTVIIHIVGLLGILFVLLITKSKMKFKKGLSLYLYSAGAIGVFTVIFNNFSYEILGASIPISLALLGQSIASIIIDHFGLLEMKKSKFNKKKSIGLTFIVLGIFIMTIF
ncbi:DMT family transporter [Clostridium weizhouense]|uniref:DMT family transporter n=1 Tax=Clostridium weizhouense TaxID=2859781 RepID=A0ABS7APP6_9CLOT|nr:DMT family transporter [Clostridium weizhouense]MBW6410594.1 DMT family transporter [Clostridium weizhouense]